MFASNFSSFVSNFSSFDLILCLLGTLVAFLSTWLLHLARQKKELEYEILNLEKEQNRLESELKVSSALKEAQDKIIQQTKEQVSLVLEASSKKALYQNSEEFLKLAESTFKRFSESANTQLQQKHTAIDQLVNPLKESLAQVDLKLQDLEKKRLSAYEVIHHQIADMVQSQKDLRSETANLAKALRTPHIRGRWGEMQLRRVVEMSGMSRHCDFIEQSSLQNEDQARLRPDMIVNLPGNKQIIVDAKAPLIGFLDALESTQERDRTLHLQAHARHIKKHIAQLSQKSYWQSVKEADSPEFVILFLPGETFFTAALEQDPSLIEAGIENKVILATPATLIAMLHAIAYGWRQEALSDNAREISALGRDMSKRLADLTQHLSKLGRSLGTSVSHFNKAVGTLDRRIFPVARKFRELQMGDIQETSGTSFEQPVQIEHAVRELDDTDTQTDI